MQFIIKLLERILQFGYLNASGRNFLGIITVRYRAGGIHRFFYIDFFRRINAFGYLVKIIKKMHFFTSWIGFVIYQNGLSGYILLSDAVLLNTRIYSGSVLKNFEVNEKWNGFSLPIGKFPLFSNVHNIEFLAFQGGKLMRAAGASSIIILKNLKFISIKLRSGWQLTLSPYVMAAFGSMSNISHKFFKFTKAGQVRKLGFRPSVRGIAMNPCDHPHGGGEGRKSPPVAARSPWGWLTKGTPSLKKKFQILRKKKYKKFR